MKLCLLCNKPLYNIRMSYHVECLKIRKRTMSRNYKRVHDVSSRMYSKKYYFEKKDAYELMSEEEQIKELQRFTTNFLKNKNIEMNNDDK